MTHELQAPRKLEKGDVRDQFCSGADELDDWLKKYAWQNQRADNCVTYVSTLNGIVVGYYAIAMAGVGTDLMPAAFAKGRPKDIPCILLARLAVDRRAHGRQLGAALLQDAIKRAVLLSESIGAACLLIHCRDDTARDFYVHQGDFLASPVDELHLVLPIKEARRLLDRS